MEPKQSGSAALADAARSLTEAATAHMAAAEEARRVPTIDVGPAIQGIKAMQSSIVLLFKVVNRLMDDVERLKKAP